jgi:1-acyl-sn-glycerol-3-phosphate acyltransferase
MTYQTPNLIPLWIILAPIVSIVFVLFVFLIHVPFYFAFGYHHRYFAYVTRSLGNTINRFIARLHVDVYGLDHIPKYGTTIFYVTHKSYTDFSVLLSIIKRPVAFTPKSDVYQIPIVNWWLQAMGSFKINRKNTRDTAKRMFTAIKTLKTGHAMVIFPEGGTKNRDIELITESKAGAFKMALKSEAMIVPVKIFGSVRVRNRMPFFHTDKKIVFLEPIPYEFYQTMNTKDLSELVMKKINEAK